jgi:hypothetical protein
MASKKFGLWSMGICAPLAFIVGTASLIHHDWAIGSALFVVGALDATMFFVWTGWPDDFR